MTYGWGAPVALGERRALHPGMLRWLRALGWMALLFVVCAIPGYGAIGLIEYLLPEGGVTLILSNSVGALICAGLYALLVWGGEGRRPGELALHAAPVEAIAGLLIGLAMFSTVMAVMAVFGLYDFAWTGAASPVQAIALSIQSGVMEEVLTRAIILRLLWRAFGPWVAFALSAAVFGALHLTNPNATSFAAVCIAVEAGVMLGAFYALTGRLWVSIGVHAAWNFTEGYLFGAPVSGTEFSPAIASSTARADLPVILTGGSFGPEASLPALLVGTAVGAGVLWLAWKSGRFAKTPAVA